MSALKSQVQGTITLSRSDTISILIDSYALLAHLNDEPGGERVQEVLRQAEGHRYRVLLCLINLGEVLYLIERRRGLATAQSVQALVESLPLEIFSFPWLFARGQARVVFPLDGIFARTRTGTTLRLARSCAFLGITILPARGLWKGRAEAGRR